jgi:hypothetical protein
VPIGANTELQSISFSGSGLIDDLYVSHGNPAYPGTMGTVPPTLDGFPGAGGPGVTNWLAQYFNDGRLAGLADFSAVSAAQLDAAYLLNEPLIGTELAPTNVPYAFGIQSFDLINPTTLRVTFKLETNGAPRSGQINGKIQLYGKVLAGDGWQAIGDPVAPTFAGDGTVTPADFSVSDTYRFFHPTIVAP